MSDASPRFRQDLEATTIEADGVPCVDVRDPQSGTNFRFYDFEYQLALQLNGQPLGDVTAWASAAYGVDLTVDGISEFAGRLSELGFLETMDTPAAADETPARGTKSSEELDSAEAEWMTTEGAQTAQFVPDPAMLDSPSEQTPVAPELPTLGGEDGAAARPSIGVTSEERTPPPAPRLFDIPMPGAKAPVPPPPPPAAPSEASTAPSLPAVNAFAPGGIKPSLNWAIDLEGKLEPEDDKKRPAPPADPADTKTPPPLPRPAPAAPPPGARATPTPAGVSERRQPPAPEAVQMTAFASDAAARKPKAVAARIIIVAILLAFVVGIVYFVRSREAARIPQAAARVRVLSPKPAAVYRWFSGRGTVTDHEARTLAFESSGTLADLLPPGTPFAAGEIIGRLRGAQPIEALLSRQRARLAFYQQLRDSMRAANNQPELRQAEIKLADKQRLIDDSLAGLAKLVVRASEPGEVVETLVKVGTPVRARVPLVKVKGRMLHGEFELDREEIASVDKLGFCRVEVVGLGPRASNAEQPAAGGSAADVGSPEAQTGPRFIDCTVEKSAAVGSKLRVTLPDNQGLVPGQPLRLARQRHDAVFPIPAAAVSGSGGRRSLWVVSATGTAERRDVVVADVADDALVSEGLRVGDEVILDAPADLRAGAPVVVER
jgi:multidrug efflux pump subunit AcrA (membrane-fusion protein)